MMKLGELSIYKISRQISRDCWCVYDRFDWQQKKTIGDQWITAIDSIGANIAEGFGRFHYLDKNKFNYNARGSLFESLHWTDVLCERKYIAEQERNNILSQLNTLLHKLNSYIASTKIQVTNKKEGI